MTYTGSGMERWRLLHDEYRQDWVPFQQAGENDARKNQLGSKHDAETGTTLYVAQTTCNEKLLYCHFLPPNRF